MGGERFDLYLFLFQGYDNIAKISPPGFVIQTEIVTHEDGGLDFDFLFLAPFQNGGEDLGLPRFFLSKKAVVGTDPYHSAQIPTAIPLVRKAE